MSLPDEKKPRCFILIKPDPIGVFSAIELFNAEPKILPWQIYVIEYSAYEKLQARVRELEAKNVKLLEQEKKRDIGDKVRDKSDAAEFAQYNKEIISLEREVAALRRGMTKVLESRSMGYALLIPENERAFNEADAIVKDREIGSKLFGWPTDESGDNEKKN